MNGEKKHIVFFTPTLNKTGSEIVLFNLLPFALDFFEVTVITKYKGELYNQLPPEVGKHYLYNKQFGGFVNRLINKFRGIFIVPRILERYKSAVWYLNTIMLADILRFAQFKKVKTIVHLHELQQMYALLSQRDVDRLVDYPIGIIANSSASAEVIKDYGRTKTLKVVHPLLDFSRIKNANPELRNLLGINSTDFVWLMSGTLDKNKNPFLFVDIAKELKQRTGNFKMLWLGGKVDKSSIEIEFEDYVRQQNCEDVIIWVSNAEADYYSYFSIADGFVLTSQFESFSLVVLESLYLGLPVVANDCIGVQEILQDDYGCVVSQKNSPQELASKMLQYMRGELSVDKDVLRKRALDFEKDKIGKLWQVCLKELV